VIIAVLYKRWGGGEKKQRWIVSRRYRGERQKRKMDRKGKKRDKGK
jgi:hypothetical protein